MTSKLDLITKGISPFKSEILGLFKEGKDEVSNFFEVGLSNYIDDKKNKFSNTNTFLSPDEKVPFYDVYFPLTLKAANGKLSKSDDLLDIIFEESNTAGIFGVAGSGKTMLFKHSFLSCYHKLFKIPIFIELRDCNSIDIGLTDFIYKIILGNRIKPSTRILENALKSGKFLFLFDGFDEIDFDKKERLLVELEQFIDGFNSNYFVFSSRPGTNLERLPRLKKYIVQSLTEDEIETFINQQGKLINDEALIGKVKSIIKKKENRNYLIYLQNPLLLSMFLLTFRSYPELPKSKNKFYWNVFDTLCTKHDSITKKGGYVHDKKSKLQIEDFENILKVFCYITLLEGKFNFDRQYLYEKLKFVREKLDLNFDIEHVIYDLKVSISLLVEEGLDFKFPHRTMQDYFAVLFIKEQNDQSKKKIYGNKLKPFLEDVHSNRNFLELCQELDKEAFYAFCLIPLLNQLCKLFNNLQTAEEKIFKFVELIKLRYECVFDLNTNEIIITGPYTRPQVLIGAVNFFSISYYEAIDIKLNDNFSKPLFLKLKEDRKLIKIEHVFYGIPPGVTVAGLYELSVCRCTKEEVVEIMKSYGKPKLILQYIKFVNKKRGEIVLELATIKRNRVEIWDI